MTPPPTIEILLTEAADVALATGKLVLCLGYAVVPDTLMIEASANGMPHEATWSLERSDGRTVHLYQAPVRRYAR